jgi:hypothetical protein
MTTAYDGEADAAWDYCHRVEAHMHAACQQRLLSDYKIFQADGAKVRAHFFFCLIE